MNREVLDRWCERGILALVLGILVFGPLATGAVRTVEFLVIQGLTLGVMTLWLLRFWLKPRPKLLWPPISWLVLVFASYAIARYLTADIEYVARQELVRVLTYTFLFFAILNNLNQKQSAQIVTLTLLFLGMAVSGYAVFQFLTKSDHVWHFISPYKGRGSGTYICPNHLAGFLEMLLPLGLAYTLVGRVKVVTRVLIGYASLIIIAGIAVTGSRGSWLACVLALIAFFGLLATHRDYRLPALVLLAVVVSACALFVSRTDFFQQRFRAFFTQASAETDVRYELWRSAARMWEDHFWWGVGPGHFDYRFRAYRPDVVQMRPDRAHNDYLNGLADWGLAGTLTAAAAILLLCWGVMKTWRIVRIPENVLKTRLSNRFAFVLGAALGLLALLLHSVTDFNLHIPANAILAVSLMALLSGYLRFASDRFWLSARTGIKVPASVVLLMGIGYLGFQGWNRAQEHACLQRAAKAPLFSRAQISALEQAHAVEPRNAETTYAIGEAYRIQSWEGNDDYVELAQKAMPWYERGARLNPYDPNNHLRHGMCLDWTGHARESGPFFDRADQLDPNGYYTAANIGWHYVQLGNYAAAKSWFERSRHLLPWKENQMADSYLGIVQRKMIEAATVPSFPTLPR